MVNKRKSPMTMILLAIALLGQLSSTQETTSLQCFDLDENQRVCIGEEETLSASEPVDKFPIIKEEVEKITYRYI
ncbi:hypothetical protein A2837_03140 [Candidatus Kaiserbacteria bacterium RIFCSPHIGHO2_01_FULL_46_22]|uniref:Uncharacterized protein n=1 Tax=Candidatus Kaiserbacteria bacterium RIFCSPHIGHO2_01_FULL_46_22 TaxID=1798475 RepID=A0A1F6BY84_9BACT|nr:MAG: hypothetical protein A2837_03140 [Candidatus Kaiserbacteria bacterium RIFCSPHIGHO2_01_FULL_46_22]